METAYRQLRGPSVFFRAGRRPVLRAGLCMVFLAAALFCAPAPLWAEVTATGDGNPSLSGTEPDPWNVSGDIRIGNIGTGTFNVENGGSVTGADGYLGRYSDSSGTVTVTGTATYTHGITPNSSVADEISSSCCPGPSTIPPCVKVPVYIGVAGARSHHPGGVNAVFVDGHVEFKSENIDLSLWQSLASINGGEIISAE